jgi:hypothetical protein
MILQLIQDEPRALDHLLAHTISIGYALFIRTQGARSFLGFVHYYTKRIIEVGSRQHT